MTNLGWKVIFVSVVFTCFIGLILYLAGLPIRRAVFVVFNLTVMVIFGFDKYLAAYRRQRIPEATLLILAAVGGSPGAFLGQVVFRHKTRNMYFHSLFLTIIAVQALLIVIIL